MEKLFCFLQKQLFALKEYLKTVNVWKKIFRVHVSDMYLFKIVSLEFLPLFEFWIFENGLVCFLYLLVEKLCHKEAHFPSTTHLSHAGQVVFLYFSLQVGFFSSILTCAFSSNFTYLLWMECTFEHNRQLGHPTSAFQISENFDLLLTQNL